MFAVRRILKLFVITSITIIVAFGLAVGTVMYYYWLLSTVYTKDDVLMVMPIFYLSVFLSFPFGWSLL